MMNAFASALMAATFFNALMAGFLFAFAVIVMPGIKELGDREFLQSFQAIDRVIQNNQPLFMIMWLGSTITLVVAAAIAVMYQSGIDRTLVVTATLASIALVQLPTMTVNIPLNNKLQTIDCETVEASTATEARVEFESRWNRWNIIRTVVSSVILAILLAMLYRL